MRLFNISEQLVAIKDNTKEAILSELETEKSFAELTSALGLPKSTLSTKLSQLKKELFISESIGNDKRKRIYRLIAKPVIKSSRISDKLYKESLEQLELKDPLSFMNSLFRSIRHLLGSIGFDEAPMLRKLGEDIGKKISVVVKSDNIEGITREMNKFWHDFKLGGVELVTLNPITILMDDCYNCYGMEKAGKAICAFDEGLLKSIFEMKLKRKTIVKEIECNGTGHGHCKFIILMGD